MDDSKCDVPRKALKNLRRRLAGNIFSSATRSQRSLPKPTDLTPIFQAIEEDLKSQYLLGFYIAEISRDNRKHVFSVSMKPEGVEYSVGRKGYSRTQKFMINLPPNEKKLPN